MTVEYDTRGIQKPKEYRVQVLNYPEIENLEERIHKLTVEIDPEFPKINRNERMAMLAQDITSLLDEDAFFYNKEFPISAFDNEADDQKFMDAYTKYELEDMVEMKFADIFVNVLDMAKNFDLQLPRYTNSSQDDIFQKDLKEMDVTNLKETSYELLKILFSYPDAGLERSLSAIIIYIDHYFQVKQIQTNITTPLYSFIEWKIRAIRAALDERRANNMFNQG